jgi:sterol desaturase/sphingolipid hydroxylase (fatty acid hydroxylase superfamily)
MDDTKDILYDFDLFGSHASWRALPKLKYGQCHRLQRGLPTWQTAVDIIYTYIYQLSFSIFKILNKYALTTNISAYVKYANTFACQNYLHKIVVLCISVSGRQN